MPALTRASLAAVFRLNPALLAALLLLIALNLCVGRGTQTDDAHRVFVLHGIDRHVKTVAFRRDADPALLVRVAGIVYGDLHRVPVELAREIEREAVLLTVRLVFLRVELEFHNIYCTYNNSKGQSRMFLCVGTPRCNRERTAPSRGDIPQMGPLVGPPEVFLML
jgi:hypothetical protein